MKWIWARRRKRMEESQRALERSERLGHYIEMQRLEAAEVGAWARERMRENHLTSLFVSGRRGT